MNKRFCGQILFLLLFPLLCAAQAYKSIGLEDGLSSNKVYAIQKDKTGFMWFLTHKGIDRYDGKTFKHYTLKIDSFEVSSLQYLNWLYTDSKGNLWEIGKHGRIFKYDIATDGFQLAFSMPEDADIKSPVPVNYSYIDNKDNIWLCSTGVIYLYNTEKDEARRYITQIPGQITYICQCKDNLYYIGTDHGIYVIRMIDNTLEFVDSPELNNSPLTVINLYYDKPSNQMFIGTFQRGLFVYDLETDGFVDMPQSTFNDISITRIVSLNNREILLATDGVGVYKLDTRTFNTVPYIVADYNYDNKIPGNNITDIYIDTTGKIWVANNPEGIIIRDNRYSFHKLYTHTTGSKESLVNNTVNQIIEDSEGDLWFATNNGVCFLDHKTNRWHRFLSTFNTEFKEKNNVFLSICESEPGIFLVGGYSSNLYTIDKKELKAETVSSNIFYGNQNRPDKYIRSIIKGSQGNIWIGGFNSLKKVNTDTQTTDVYPEMNSITVLLDKDDSHLWIGSSVGLYLMDKTTGTYEQVQLPTLSSYIYSLCQYNNKLYIGTNGSGLLVYDLTDQSFTRYNKENSSLISNNIYTILSNDDTIILSTGRGLTRIRIDSEKLFNNWTKEQGLNTNQFCASSGIVRENGNFVFGSTQGAIELDKKIQIPTNYPSRMVLSEFRLFDKTVTSVSENSPLSTDINETEEITLNHNQNVFSLKVSDINYDYPSNILYSWKLEGFYDDWSDPGTNDLIHFTNINPGKYNLRIRTISKEDKSIIEERDLAIRIRPPFWRSPWFVFVYLTIGIGILFLILRSYYLKKQRKAAADKFEFFINTAHDIRTPLTLVKAPLDEIAAHEQLSPEGARNVKTAMRNVNVLLRLTNNLINFEHTDIYSSDVFIAEHELNSLITEIVNSFQSYASMKQVIVNYKPGTNYLNVWFDKEKMDSIIRNIISNAVKYTPSGGTIEVSSHDSQTHWSVVVKDTGIGIPDVEQKKLFKDHFRGSNAINSKITGSGMGMVLVARLVKLHKGKIYLQSSEDQGTTIRVTFPKGYNHFKKAHLAMPYRKENTNVENFESPVPESIPVKINPNGKRILIVEDNDELRTYLQDILSDDYHVQVCENGRDALNIVKDYMPELIISDIMMPEMRGDELCSILKKDLDTSHIPIILLTALNDERSIIKGIQTGADEYVTKPFNTGIFKATIANLLMNRARLRSKFANLEMNEDEEEKVTGINCNTDLDWKFISTLRKIVEENMHDTNFSVDSLCAEMNMSRTSLYNKVKALTDTAPNDFMRTIRLNKAAEFLKAEKYTVTEVAEMTGFGDAKYFREVFKKHFDISPSKYKDKDKNTKE